MQRTPEETRETRRHAGLVIYGCQCCGDATFEPELCERCQKQPKLAPLLLIAAIVATA
jgi:hypothetical protein